MRRRRRLTSFLALWLGLAIGLPPAPAYALRGAQILQNQSGVEELQNRMGEPSEQIAAVRERAQSLARIFERLLFNLVKQKLGRPISWTEARQEIEKGFYQDSELAELMRTGGWRPRDILLILFKRSSSKIPAGEMTALLGDDPVRAIQWAYFYFSIVKETVTSWPENSPTDETMYDRVRDRILTHFKDQSSILELGLALGIIQRSAGFLSGMQVMAGEEIGRTFPAPNRRLADFKPFDLNNEETGMVRATLADWAGAGILVIRGEDALSILTEAIVAERERGGSFKDVFDFKRRMQARPGLKISSTAWTSIALRSEFEFSDKKIVRGVLLMAAIGLAIMIGLPAALTWLSERNIRVAREIQEQRTQALEEPRESKPARQNPDYKLPGPKNSSQFQEISLEELYRQPVGVFLPAPIRQIASQKLIGKQVVIRGRMAGDAEGVVTEIVGVLEKVTYDNGVFYELILAKEFRILKGAPGLSTRSDGSPAILIYVDRKDPIQIELAPEEKAGMEQVKWLAEGVGIRKVGEKEELVISKSLLDSALPETKSVKVVAQQSVSSDALILFGVDLGFLPEDPAGVQKEVERVMGPEGTNFVVALDASIPVKRMAEYLPKEHPFTVLLEAGEWERYQGIAQAILRVPVIELRNRIIQFTEGSARTVRIDNQEFVALDISA